MKEMRVTSNEMTVKELDEATEIAYSYDRYSRSGWRGCISLLRSHGLSDLEVQAFLRSKHMRWAADGSTKPYGRHNSSCLKAYIERYADCVSRKKLDELVAGTF